MRERGDDHLRCCVYARVSSDEQADRNLSIPAQLEACRYYAKGKGWTVAVEYHDGFESAKPGKMRPTFEKMMSAARRKEFDAILVHKLDRFARDDYEHVVSERELEKLGIRLESVSEPLDPSSPAGYLSRRIMQVISSWYIKNLATEALKGMKQKVAGGGWPWKAPLGYVNRHDKNGSWVEVHPEVGPMITRAFEEFATGKYTLDSWTEQAFSLGYRSGSGSKIGRSHWQQIFRHRFYLGKTFWRSEGMERDGKHPALSDPVTFARVQEILSTHDHHKKRLQRHKYLLRGLLYSVDADSTCTASTQVSKGISYYRSKAPVNGSKVYYGCERIDRQVWELMQSLTIARESRPVLEKTLKSWLAEMGEEGGDTELSRARARLAALEKKRKNVNRMAAEDIVSWEEFTELRDEVEHEEATLKSRIAMLTRHQALLAADFELALDIACNLGWLYDRGNNDERRLLAETIFKRIDVQKGRVVSYELNPPFGMFLPTAGPGSSPIEPTVRLESSLAPRAGFEPTT